MKNFINKSGTRWLTPGFILLGGIVFVILAILAYGLLVWHGFANWNERGAFGDSFGLANALFAGLAFVGLLAALAFQQRDLDLQRDELERTRVEFERSARAQEKALDEQVKGRWYAEYLSIQSDFSSSFRTLIANGEHANIYDDLALRGGSRFVAWDKYSERDKVVYAYLELVYETFERVFVVRAWIPNDEWSYWEQWIDDVIGHPLIEHVYQDNEGMFDKDFELYFKTRLLQAKKQSSK